MVCFGEEVPALHQQPGVLDDECRRREAQAQKGDRQSEGEEQEPPAHPAQRTVARAMEELVRVERAGGEALRDLAHARLVYADRALQGRAWPQPGVSEKGNR